MTTFIKGTLYGVGVGPGDPDLVTVKALKVLRSVSTIFAACSTKNDYSLAHSIVEEHLGRTEIELMPFPMTRDQPALQRAWDQNARRVLEILNSGRHAAFITLGDPLTYSTFAYLLRTVRRFSQDVRVETVPGITSYHAAAAAANTPLTEGEESFHLISGAMGGAHLQRVFDTSDNVVMLKTYRHFDDIYATLESLNLLDHVICVTRVGLEGQAVVEDIRTLKGGKMPYLSLIIIKRKGLESCQGEQYQLLANSL
ncbi:MAG: precorrin-2 C(20)-methyltransferase [Pseudomonadota bacterium]